MDTLHLPPASVLWHNAILPVLTAAALWLAATGIGLALLRAAAPRRAPTAFEWTLAPALGFALIGYLSDLLFMTGGLDMRPVYVAWIGIGVALFAWQARSLRPARPRVAAARPDAAFWIAGWLIVAWFGVKLVIGNVTPVNDNDSIYHYAFYSRLLSSGATFDQILLLRNFPVTDLNRIVQHVYAAGGTLGGDGGLHMMNFLFLAGIALLAQGLSAGVLRISRWANPLPVLAVLTLREILYTGFSAKLDYGVAWLELSAVALFMTWRERRLWIAAAGLGFAICARTNSLRLLAVIPFIWLVEQILTRRASGGPGRIALRTLAAVAGVLLVAAPPYAMQQFIYGNPFFPMFNGVFGEYTHYYEWVILDTLRYRTSYGWFGAVAVYASVALRNLIDVPGVVTPQNTPFGLSPLMLLAPLAMRRSRTIMWLLAFVAIGYLTWYVQSNTNRTLLSVAAAAVVLTAAFVNQLRARFAVLHFGCFAAIILLAAWNAYGFLGMNSLVYNYYYVAGQWDRDDYNDRLLRLLYPGVVPEAADIAAISAIVGREPLASIDLTPFADDRLIRTRRLLLPAPGVNMRTIAADERADPMDRRIARELMETPYVVRQARDVAARLWPESGDQRPLTPGADTRWYLRASHDAFRHVADWIAEEPRRLAPMLRFEGVRFVLAGSGTVFGSREVEGLSEVWRRGELVLLRVDD